MEEIRITAEELREFEAFRKEKEAREAATRRKQMRADYARMVDDELTAAIPELLSLSAQIKTVKQSVYGNFEAILRLKADMLGIEEFAQHSHTFTSADSRMRLTLGHHTIDAYRDTVNEGIAMVKSYIESLAKDDNSRALVNAVLRLLSRDASGNLKASRVLQLRKMADETGDERFQEGVRIIEESYQPTETKRYIRAELKNEGGAWVSIPLGMTECN